MLKTDDPDAVDVDHGGIIGIDWVGFALAAIAIPVPLASFYVTFSYVRIDLGVSATSALFTIVVSGVFTLVLIASLLTNAVIIASRMLRRNEWHVSRALVMTQVGLLLAIAAWLASLAGAYNTAESDTLWATLASASAIAVSSIVVFALSSAPARHTPQVAAARTVTEH